MRLRWKLNLFASGFCSLGAIFGAMANIPALATADLVLAVVLWHIAVMGIERDLKGDN